MTETDIAVLEEKFTRVSQRKPVEDDFADRQRPSDIDAYEKLFHWVASINAKVDRLLDEKPQPPKITSPYLTAAEAAAYLRLENVKQLYGLIERGKLKPLPGYRKLRFTTAILDEYLRGEQ